MIEFENVRIFNFEGDSVFIVAVKDRTVRDGETWVTALLTEDEMKTTYECLKTYFDDKDQAIQSLFFFIF